MKLECSSNIQVPTQIKLLHPALSRWCPTTILKNCTTIHPAGGRSDRGGGQGDSLYPVGYLDKQVPDTSVQETDRILVEKRCWDIALGPLKQIPMNLFIMYMAGNTISIFPTMMVCMMAWRPIQALMAISATFKMLESSSQKFLQGLVYLIGNLMGLALAVYKCQSMGLLPTHASDWLAFIEPPERMEFSGGGLLL
uniref:ER membrane protein complex subunit 4 n=1 Tax=Capra hircus TaxID=9925 RepID=A0A8C2QVA3_CAPHI